MNKSRLGLICLVLVAVIVAVAGMPFGSTVPGTAFAAGPSQLGLVKVPVVLDGVQISADQYNAQKDGLVSRGVVLRYILTPEAQQGKFVYVFTSYEKANEFMKQHGLPDGLPVPGKALRTRPSTQDRTTALAVPARQVTHNAQHYQDVDFWGDQLDLDIPSGWPSAGYSDLRSISCQHCPYGNWNDQISSLKVRFDTYSALFGDINYGGAAFYHTPGSYADLNNYGWSDFASSVYVWWYA